MKNYALKNNYTYEPQGKLNRLPSKILSEIGKEGLSTFNDIVKGEDKGISFSLSYFDVSKGKHGISKHTLIVIKNKKIDLPCFYTQAKTFFNSNSSSYAISLYQHTDFFLTGRPEKRVKQLFTNKICDAVNRFYEHSKCKYIEGVSEFIVMIYESHILPEELDNLRISAMVLSNLFSLNEEFNTNHIN